MGFIGMDTAQGEAHAERLRAAGERLEERHGVLDALVRRPDLDFDDVDRFCRAVLAFVGVDHDAANAAWPTWFMRDTELRWVHEEPAIDDL